MRKFVFWSFDFDVFYIDVFILFWLNLCLYIFLFFKLIGRIINKILEDRVR